MDPIELRLSEELRSRLVLGLLRAEPVEISPSSPALLAETERLGEELRADLGGRAPAEIEGLRPARELYKSFGIDPTKRRPSSEALLRRVLRGKPLPRILNAVDLCNLLALRFLLPIGLYDVAKLRGPVLLRRGEEGEFYAGIRKDRVHLSGRPVLVDAGGPFGNPTSDSLRTCVDESTRALWMVVFAPASCPREAMAANVRTACEAIERHLAPEGAAARCEGRVDPAPDRSGQ
jgi:DNA/RNA-binding domain of Phe-tRNA-synthetase-like protein